MTAGFEGQGSAGVVGRHFRRPTVIELRETLGAYRHHGQSIKAANAVRGVHRETVRHHIGTIEDRLRHPISERSAELILALRLQQLFTADPSTR